MTKSAGLPPKLPSSSAHVITSKEKKCTCCLLHPTGTRLSPWYSSFLSSSSEPPHISPLVSDLIQMGVVNRPKISFQASHTSKNSSCNMRWQGWVKEMAKKEKFVRTWHNAGIHDAIVVASVSADIKLDRKAMEALFGFWCPASNTFTFPWGETGLTIEDTHVLTGLPIGGSELDRKHTKEEEELQMRLILEMKKMLEVGDTDGTITHDIWLEWFMNMKDIDDELMHLGFLTYWLSKDIFPSPDPAQDAAFGLAARLSLGEKIALAPSLVANIYHNLNSMTESHLTFQGKKKVRRKEQLKAWASFSILQCWIWERFENLRPSSQCMIPQQSRIRITRWSGRQSKNMYEYAMKIFQDERQFTWRPYSRRLGQMCEPEWYNMESHNIAIGGRDAPTYAYEFLAVISCTQLKGICEDGYVFSENYYPNRFARQFGFDQAIPDVADTCLASSLNETSNVRIQLFIPGITRCGNPRSEYTEWWKAYRSSYDDDRKAFEIEKAGDGYKGWNKKDDNRNLLGSDAEKSEDTSKKRKAGEISRIASTRKLAVGCRHQLVHGTSNTTITKSSVGLIYPLYSSLQLLYKRRDTVEAVGISGKEDPTNLKINIDSDVELVMYDVQPPELCQKEEAVSVHKEERLLVDELDKFQSLGLMTKRELSPEVDGSTDRHFEEHKDTYGQEAIDNYPQFFKLIPQNPHYKGILEGMTASEDMKRDILLGQWYMLVNLMGEALKMNGESDSTKIERMMKKALTLEKSGFDVRHLIARLNFLPKLKHLK